MVKVLRGVVHGRTIELESESGIEDGRRVEVIVRSKTLPGPPPGWRSGGTETAAGMMAEYWTEEDDRIFEEIERDYSLFGKAGKIFLVHFRFVKGAVPRYTEVFIDEGDLDPLESMKAYREVGFPGPFVSDHTPAVEGDTRWGHRGRAFSLGYMRALVHAVNAT